MRSKVSNLLQSPSATAISFVCLPDCDSAGSVPKSDGRPILIPRFCCYWEKMRWRSGNGCARSCFKSLSKSVEVNRLGSSRRLDCLVVSRGLACCKPLVAYALFYCTLRRMASWTERISDKTLGLAVLLRTSWPSFRASIASLRPNTFRTFWLWLRSFRFSGGRSAVSAYKAPSGRRRFLVVLLCCC